MRIIFVPIRGKEQQVSVLRRVNMMRLQPQKTIVVRSRVLGGDVPWICLPLVAEDRTILLEQAQAVLEYNPDALEWRVDKFECRI